MIKIEKQEITIDYELRKKIENGCKFSNSKSTILNGNIIKLKCTNIVYTEPYKIIIKNTLFLAFNNHEFIYLGNLQNKLSFKEFEILLHDLTKSY